MVKKYDCENPRYQFGRAIYWQYLDKNIWFYLRNCGILIKPYYILNLKWQKVMSQFHYFRLTNYSYHIFPWSECVKLMPEGIYKVW